PRPRRRRGSGTAAARGAAREQRIGDGVVDLCALLASGVGPGLVEDEHAGRGVELDDARAALQRPALPFEPALAEEGALVIDLDGRRRLPDDAGVGPPLERVDRPR